MCAPWSQNIFFVDATFFRAVCRVLILSQTTLTMCVRVSGSRFHTAENLELSDVSTGICASLMHSNKQSFIAFRPKKFLRDCLVAV